MAVAVDTAGNIYVAGSTASANFPVTAGAYDTSYHASNDVFVAKLTPAGSVAWATYLGGSSHEVPFGIAVDTSGNVYVTGQTTSADFPTTLGAFQTAYHGNDAFVTKINPNGTALIYSTYLGGGWEGEVGGLCIAVDSSGNAYIGGSTRSSDFPTTPGAFQTTKPGFAGVNSATVTKLDPTGSTLIYSTFLGGTNYFIYHEQVSGIAVDGDGNAYVSGVTAAVDFPTTPGAFQTTSPGPGPDQLFVAKLNASGSGLIYSTYLGSSEGASTDGGGGGGIAIDSSGNAYVTGTTRSPNFPTTPGALQTVFGGGSYDAFVSKLNATGTGLVFSTYLGGSGDDYSTNYAGIALDGSGNVYVSGYTSSTDFPTANAVQATYGGGPLDAYVAKLNASGTALDYSTYLGGSGAENQGPNAIGGLIAVDAAGNAYVTGITASTDFPVANPFQATSAGDSDAFIAKVGAELPSLVVTTAGDVIDPYDGLSSLREAVGYANTLTGDNTITFNTAQMGADTITLTQGQLELTAGSGTVIIDGGGQVTISGGGTTRIIEVDSGARAILAGLTIRDGYDAGGGAIRSSGMLIVENCTLSDNHAEAADFGYEGDVGGGAMVVVAGTVSIIDSTLSGNSADSGNGGAIVIMTGTVSIARSSLTGNTAQHSGGAILNSGTLLIDQSTLSGNTAGFGGGGIYNVNFPPNSDSGVGGTMSIINSTICGNTALDFSGNGGGGIFLDSGAVSIINSTISSNTAPTGVSGLLILGSAPWSVHTLVLQNTIIAGNIPGGGAPDLSGDVTSLGHNLIGNTTGNSGWVGSDLLNVDPLLGPLADNGGPTRTMALLPGSPAIDAGSDSVLGPPLNLVTDQRGVGFPRLLGNAVDVGAFESPFAANAPPVAADDAVAMYGNSIIVAASYLLANDSDADGNPLGVVLVDAPSKGTLADNGDGTYTYTIGAGFGGLDSFTYRASDGTDLSNLATVTITHQLYVRNTNDSGDGSLRWTITNANSHPGPDTIRFAIPATDPGYVDVDWTVGGDSDPDAFVIRPKSALPALTGGGTTIDGRTQAAFGGDTNPFGPEIVLDGSSAGSAVGLRLASDNNAVMGLNIQHFSATGIMISGNPSGAASNVIAGNYIGTNATGTAAAPNNQGIEVLGGAHDNAIGGTAPGAGNVISGNTSNGIGMFESLVTGMPTRNTIAGNYIGTNASGTAAIPNRTGIQMTNAANNTIGGTDPGAGNVISGNTNNGISVAQALATGNVIAGNYIGTNQTGTAAVPNGTGINVSNAPDNTIGGTAPGARNVISGNRFAAVALSSAGNVVAGNYIGTDASGTAAVGNYGGVVVAGANNMIGGTDSAARNVISGNRNYGVNLSSTGNVIAGNYIGTNASGAAAVPNGTCGILVAGGADNTIGGTAPGAGNVISGNSQDGVYLAGSTATGNAIFGNHVGTDASGTAAVPNGGSGIYVRLNASNTTIGGTLAGQANTIAFNSGAGVWITETSDTGNVVRGNAIYGNGGLGIDLDGTGVTPNDPYDADSGPNNLQNFPVVALAEPGAATRVAGSLDSAANTTFTIDFYLNDAADPSGYGEGQQWLGAITVTTDSSGHADFDHVFSAATSFGQLITATATDPGGNTSEFSGAYVANAVQIDVKPGDSAASLNLASNGMIAVVLYSSFGFDAQSVDIGSVTFAGATVAMNSFEDVDGDGDLDAVFHFETQQTNLRALYVDLLLDDADADGVLDSTRQLATVSMSGTTTDDLSWVGSDQLNLFLAGKKLRELLDQLHAEGLL